MTFVNKHGVEYATKISTKNPSLWFKQRLRTSKHQAVLTVYNISHLFWRAICSQITRGYSSLTQRRLDSCHVNFSTNQIALFFTHLGWDFCLENLHRTEKTSKNIHKYSYICIKKELWTYYYKRSGDNNKNIRGKRYFLTLFRRSKLDMSSQDGDLRLRLFTIFKQKYLKFPWFDFSNFFANISKNIIEKGLPERSPWSPGNFRDIRH